VVTHGTLTAYMHGKCRCADCQRTYSRYMKQLRHDMYQGKPSRLVDATPAHRHVAALLADGMSFNAITKAAGYTSRNALQSVMDRPRCQPRTLARILAVTWQSERRPQSYVNATGSTERVRELALLGWPLRWVAEQVGAAPDTMHDIANGRRPKVRRATAQAILGLHARIGGTPGPSTRTAAWAAARFREQPASETCGTCEDADWLTGAGESFDRVAERLGLVASSLERHLYRHGRADLIRRAVA
jgi:lambda repressor-like predicted transcriptional regulator